MEHGSTLGRIPLLAAIGAWQSPIDLSQMEDHRRCIRMHNARLAQCGTFPGDAQELPARLAVVENASHV